MRAVVLEVGPAYCDLDWVVFVRARKATIARTCRKKEMWLKGTGNRFEVKNGSLWERTSGSKLRTRLVDVLFLGRDTS